MASISCMLALLSGAVGAGFASGREIVCFFACHGYGAGAAVVFALATLFALLLALPARMEDTGCASLQALCRVRFGLRLGRLCAGLFFLLCAVTGGAMLAACAELCALALPIRHAYGAGLSVSLLLGALLALGGLRALALPGLALCLLLPALFARLFFLPAGEACFLPGMTPDLPVRAAADGAVYAALNAALLAGIMPMLLPLSRRERLRSAALFTAVFGLLLTAGVWICLRHLPAVLRQPLPFVALQRLSGGSYLPVAAAMYAAALSSLPPMLLGMARMLPLSRSGSLLISALICLALSLAGFTPLIESGYPALGSLCATLLFPLCFPAPAASSS